MAAQRDAFDDDEDTHVRVGTAFKLLETDEDIAKHKEKKLKEQYVRDKQGRIRFHGAFTGGFSAGYYNTVGSKEGWAPSAFTSSRSSKQQSKQQRPEDFMDEEDLDVFGIAPREISTRDLFNKEAFGVDQGGIRNASSVIPGVPPLQDLIVPAKSTIGARLLKAMGWKEGQGVGPKISRPIMTNPSASQRVYGCSLPQEDESFMFAPNDVAPWKYHSKEDSHGIGYQGMLEQGALSSTTTSKSLYGMYGQAFGVGALEEEDEDIYAQENLMSYSTTISSEGELSRSQKFGWTGSSYEAWSLDSFNKMSSKWRLLKVS
jgi:G patch domain-containing protein 1